MERNVSRKSLVGGSDGSHRMTQGSHQRGHLPQAEAGRRGVPVVGVVLGTLLLGGGAAAQTVPAPARAAGASAPATSPAPAEPNGALSTLAEQVEYWRAQNRPELAMTAVERLLAATPRDPDVLASAADVAVQLGRNDEAVKYLATLRRVAPSDPRVGIIERQRTFSDADRAALEEARALAQSGRAADAVARYRALFPQGNIPDNIAPEFYRTLASIDFQSFREATNSLRALVERNPDNPRLQLTLAQIQTYRETTRYTGIDTLIRLTKNPTVAVAAKAAWREALLWEGPSGELITAINNYLTSNPTDAQIQAKLQEAKSSLPDESTQARIRGFDLLLANDIEGAEKEFNKSLSVRADESTAMAGLGLVRLNQGRLVEARELRDRAIATAPDRRQEFMNMFDRLGFAYLSGNQTGDAEQTFQNTLNQSPEDAGALAGLGLVRLQQGKLNEARDLRDRAMASAPERGEEFAAMFIGLGYAYLRAGQMDEADKTFKIQLEKKPADPDLLAGLAYVRIRQNRLPEARELRERALANAGSRRAELSSMLAGVDGSGNRGGAAGRPGSGGAQGNSGGGTAAASPSVLARQALNRNDLERADQLARRAAAGNPGEQVAAETLLGQIALRRDDLTTAEVRFRAALARQPRLPEALGGLYEVLQRQNRFAEAEALRQETGFTPAAGSGGQRAYALRDEASRSDEPARAMELLAQAKAFDPQNPWVRMDIVRRLRGQGQEAAAAQEEAELTGLGNADSSYAAALLAVEEERFGEAVTRLESIPNRLRSPDATRLLGQARQQGEIARLEQLARSLPRSDAMDRLVAMAARPDPSGTMAAGVVRALGRLQQPQVAARAARAALATNRNATVDAKVQLAGALLSAQRLEDAEVITSNLLVDGNLTDEQRRQVAALTAGAAIAESGRLNAEGRTDAALARLQPALRDLPDSASVNMAVARVYLASNRATDAQGLADAVLERSPGNLEALTVATDAALARRDWRRAEALLQDARSRHPNDAQIMMLDARLARAQGDHYRALRALENAAVRRYAQLQAESGRGPTDAGLLAARLRNSAGDAGAGGTEIADPVASQIVNELAAARRETVNWLQAGLGVRGRSGQGGLSRLNEVTAPVEASAAVPGLGGRVTARADTVVLNSGSLNNSITSLRQFGTNPLAGATTTGMADPGGRATGVALNVGYAYGDLKADIGSTPLGFRMATVAGGVEYAPALAPGLRLRMTGDRRAVSDSLLSYGGMRDSRTGTTWGNVTATGGRAQLEYSASNNTVFYGGGGYAAIDGRRVASNSRFDLGGGVSWTVLRQPDQEVTLGVDARYSAYDKNLRYFTLGQGGYFSPQSQFSAVVQADWRKRYGDLRLRLGGALGWQTYREDDSPVFPNDAALQAQLVAAAAGDRTLNARYSGSSGSGVIGGLRAEAEYDITPQWRLGASATYDRSGNWSQAAGLVRLRYSFEQPGPELMAIDRTMMARP
jgi:tetratricopeptide (TPR) repeat protein